MRAALVAVLLAVTLVYPWTATDYALRVLTQSLLLAYFAQCWNIAGGYAGQFSLGHTVFLAAGGYTSALLFLRLGVSPWIGMVAGALLAALIAVLVSVVTFRYKVSGIYFGLFTLALATVVEAVVSSWELLGRSNGLLLPLENSWSHLLFTGPRPYYFLILIMVVAVAAVTYRVERTRTGRYFVALREDPQAAEASGVDTARAKLTALTLSAFLIAFGGTFLVQYFRFISPGILLTFEPTLAMLLGTMVGGAGTVVGPILGGLFFNLLSEGLRLIPFLSAGSKGGVFTTIVYAVVLIITIQYFPGGLAQILSRRFRSRPRAVDPGTPQPEPQPVGDPGFPTGAVHRAGAAPGRRTTAEGARLQVDSLTKRLGGLLAVNDVGFEVAAGQALGLIGPNGAGKTTLFNCLSGYMVPTSGRILFDGSDIAGSSPSALCKLGLARTFQITKPFPEMTALETVALAAHNRIADAAAADEEAAEVLRFVKFRAPTETLGKDLSVVNRKRLELARALATQPRFLLLDEICAGLNPEEVREVVELVSQVKEQGVSIIMVEHVLEAVMAVSDRILVLQNGTKIAEGAPAEVVLVPQVIEAYLGTSGSSRIASTVLSQ